MFVRAVVVAVLFVAIAAPPALARPQPVYATARVSEGYYPVTGDTPYAYTSEPCALVIRASRDVTAYDVLVAATRRGCISSYDVVDSPPYGRYLRCVEGRCEATGFYWAIYRNGELDCGGLDATVVTTKDEITFSYEPYPTALALATCA